MEEVCINGISQVRFISLQINITRPEKFTSKSGSQSSVYSHFRHFLLNKVVPANYLTVYVTAIFRFVSSKCHQLISTSCDLMVI